MEAGEAADEPERDEAVGHENDRGWRLFHGLPDRWVIVVHEKLDVERRHDEHEDAEGR